MEAVAKTSTKRVVLCLNVKVVVEISTKWVVLCLGEVWGEKGEERRWGGGRAIVICGEGRGQVV